ncbi:unnamed protein product [Candida verbasci]|uniref:4-nitrophenylphosphatase n=1 Tax=Candida verbasci TaxID=1227364 RepID=A0A9W4XBK3_9ASCO|nr:unnamed protein product [Candida verbasci]
MTIDPIYISTKEDSKLIFQYDNFIFDCDGVIWLDETLIPKVLEFLNYLLSNNKNFIFVTNNSSKSRKEYVKKFQRLGINFVTNEMIFPTCYSAVLEVQRLQIPKNSKIWVFGEKGIEEELKLAGYIPVGGTDPKLDAEWNIDLPLMNVDSEVKAVIVGSTKKINYYRIASTLQYLLYNNESLPFIGTNIDKTYPAGKFILPAGGSCVNYMSFTSGREFIDVGKPSKDFLQIILDKTGFNKERTLMVGDTLYTDIKFGNDGKLGVDNKSSLLVLTGGTTLKDLDDAVRHSKDNSIIPSYCIESLTKLIELLE